jgi:MOSC domain-containing protein YiiM
VLTAIFKTPVSGAVKVGRLNIEGDQQADLTVHGGFHKAVYAYPHEHYPAWCAELGVDELPFGMFGENLTTEGLSEADVCIGDRFQAGSAVLQVTQPRMPCFKLGIRFGRPDMVKRFWASGRSGFYLSVAVEGELHAGDRMERIEAGSPAVSVSEVVRTYAGSETTREQLLRALSTQLSPEWKKELREKLAVLSA